MRNVLLIPFIGLCFFSARSQTLGGNSVYNFLKLSNTPQLTGLGGINISNQTTDIGLAFNNPALLRSSMHSQAGLVFNSFYAGIKNYHLMKNGPPILRLASTIFLTAIFPKPILPAMSWAASGR
jgi:hypothetical protein